MDDSPKDPKIAGLPPKVSSAMELPSIVAVYFDPA
jgi:hypothetical protein